VFGLGRKDRDGRQVRLEHRGRNLRASRTGGAALRAEASAGPITATANTARGFRLSARLLKGLRVGLQSGVPFLIGRWGSGPVALNLSKSGASISVKTGVGRLNLAKPGRSSAKIAGIQVRGRKAAQINLAFLLIALPFQVAGLALRLGVAVAGLLVRIGGLALALGLGVAALLGAAVLLPFTAAFDLAARLGNRR
jgi:hypothetical protein